MTTASQPLPAKPDFEHIKKQAKRLLREECELRQLRGGTLAEQAERFIHHACLRYEGDDQAWRHQRASEWLRRLPQLPLRDFFCALVAADLEAVRDFLEKDPALALGEGGPCNWPALLYVTYSRVEQNREHAVAVARLLLQCGASPDSCVKNMQGFTAVTGAVGEGERGPIACIPHPCARELVTLLLDAGANPNQSQALYNTMLGEHLGEWLPIFVQYGLKAGDRANWNPDDREPIFDFLLSQVVIQGKLDMVCYLLEHGANPDAVSRYNRRSCLTNARLACYVQIADLLVKFGARAEPLRIDDQFRIACGRHDLALAQTLLQQYPNLRADDELFRDCAMVDVDTCLWLMQQGFDINTPNRTGQTVLHNYALWNNPAAISKLLQHGADPDRTEYHWQATALGMALHHHHWPVIDVLLPVSNNILDVSRMADAQRAAQLLAHDPSIAKLRTPMGNNPLHLVSQAMQDDPDLAASIATIELLLKYGADPMGRNNEGKTPEQWVRSLGMDEVADYMAERFARSDTARR